MNRSTSGLSAVQKACLVLRELSTPGPHRLSTIVANTGINKATAIRILETLVNEGFAYREAGSKRYELGTEALVINAAAMRASRLAEQAGPSLARLADASGDAACLALAAGDHWVCISRREGSFAIQAQYVQVGRRLPIGIGSAGLALLACRSDQEIAEILERCAVEVERFGRVSRRDIRQGVVLARERGYALSTNVIWEGTGGIATPVCDAAGQPVAALGITALAERIVKRRVLLGTLLLEESKRLHEMIARMPTSESSLPAAGSSRSAQPHPAVGSEYRENGERSKARISDPARSRRRTSKGMAHASN